MFAFIFFGHTQLFKTITFNTSTRYVPALLYGNLLRRVLIYVNPVIIPAVMKSKDNKSE